MQIETGRLLIRRFSPHDWEDLHDYLSDADVVRFEPYLPHSVNEAKKEAARRSEDENFWAVCLKSGKLIGNIYLAKGAFDTWELGYVFNKSHWGKGYAREGAKALMDWAFCSQNARRVIALCDPLNEASWRLLERLSMRREGFLKKNVYFFRDGDGNPIWKDTFEYGILKEEWPA